MPHVSLVTAGRSCIKVSAVCLCLSCARPVCTVIMDDSTTGYGVINRAPPVIVCCVRGIFSPNFGTNPSLLAFNLLRRWSPIWAKAPAPPWALWLHSLQPRAAGAGVILQADSDPGRDEVGPLWSSPLLKCPQGVCVCGGGVQGRVVAGGQFILCLPLPHSALWWPCRPAMPTGESKGRGSGGSWSLRCTCWTQMLTQPDEGLLKTYSPGPHHFSLLFPSLSVFFSDLTELSSDSWPFPWHWIVPPSTIGSLFTHPWLSPQGEECAAYTT